jgi:hypothetical protein
MSGFSPYSMLVQFPVWCDSARSSDVLHAS